MIAERLRRILSIDPAATAIRYRERDIRWGEVAAIANGVEALLAKGGVPPGVWVGWVARNDPSLVAAAMGILISGRSIAPFSPHQPATALAEEIVARKPGAVIACSADWTPQLEAAVRTLGAVGVEVDLSGEPRALAHGGLEQARYAAPPAPANGDAIERLTSGTTGRPKRIRVNGQTLHDALLNAADTESGTTNLDELQLQTSPSILLKPFAHSGGFWSMLMPVFHARTMALYERFTAEAWIDSVKRYQPRVSGLVPAMIKMILDSDAKPEDLASLRAVRSATAPLDPEVQQQFEERFGIPVLIDYGASEFIGGVAGWGLRDHEKYGKSKRGSVGRPRRDVAIRILDMDSGAELPAGETGILALKSDRFGPDWIRTTDLASLDADGFLYIRGRSDEAIIRGGFKVLPEAVAETLRLHPEVYEACVLGVKDARLGAVPVAFVEPRPGAQPSADALREFLQQRLAGYQIPVAFEFVDKLPRTVSAKISRPGLRQQYAGRYDFT